MKTLSDYPTFLRPLFVAVATSMDRPQVHPGILRAISSELPGFAPGQVVTIQHVTGEESGRRKGYYEVNLVGPEGALRWHFSAGEIQGLAQEALGDATATRMRE